MSSLSKILYFCPVVGSTNSSNEIDSIINVVNTLTTETGIDIQICPAWANLMAVLQEATDPNLLVVFRLDFLEKEHIMLDEVLMMLSTLTKFVADKKQVNIAVVVPAPCNSNLLAQLKRNSVLGIIPGMRFFDKCHSIEAYLALRQGKSHWPKIAISNSVETKSPALTNRQYEIFTLVAKRGLSNKKIAQVLNINEDTVKTHVGAILKKYGVRNRTQLALANKTGVIE